MLWGLHLFVWIQGPLRSFLLTVSAFPSSSSPVLCVNFFHRNTFYQETQDHTDLRKRRWLSSSFLSTINSLHTLSFVATWLQKHLLSPPHTSIAWRLNLLVWIQDPPSALILISPNFFFILLNIALGVLFGPYLHSQRTPLPLVWTSAPYLFCTVPLCFSLSSSPLLCIK